MIDLHCHILPAIDDGARDMATALRMARIALDDGISHQLCTPHIYPGVFDNTPAVISAGLSRLQEQLQRQDLALVQGYGADIQIVPDLIAGLRQCRLPTLNGGRYFLFEPTHHIVPAGFMALIDDSLAAGFVPLITHPERLHWIDGHFDWFTDAARRGAWIQLTAGALTGRFGKRIRYWAERFLDGGWVHVLATDAHDCRHRPPLLAEGVAAAGRWVGDDEARRMVWDRPLAVWRDAEPTDVLQPPAIDPRQNPKWRKPGLLRRWFS
jgi:protein-tyrosine phosphatase